MTGDFNPRTPCGVRRILIYNGAIPNYFNPRTPCGVRLDFFEVLTSIFPFQSTHPVRGATCGADRPGDFAVISIHAPRAGCD